MDPQRNHGQDTGVSAKRQVSRPSAPGGAPAVEAVSTGSLAGSVLLAAPYLESMLPIATALAAEQLPAESWCQQEQARRLQRGQGVGLPGVKARVQAGCCGGPMLCLWLHEEAESNNVRAERIHPDTQVSLLHGPTRLRLQLVAGLKPCFLAPAKCAKEQAAIVSQFAHQRRQRRGGVLGSGRIIDLTPSPPLSKPELYGQAAAQAHQLITQPTHGSSTPRGAALHAAAHDGTVESCGAPRTTRLGQAQPCCSGRGRLPLH